MVAKRQELAADPEVAPTRILARHPDNQLAALPLRSAVGHGRSASVGHPLPSHQSTVPAEHRLRFHQQSRPARSRDAFAKRRHNHPITWTPTHPGDLLLQNLDLAPEGKHFGLQAGLVGMDGRHGIQQDAK